MNRSAAPSATIALLISILVLAILIGRLIASPAANAASARAAATTPEIVPSADDRAIYLIRLADPPLAAYDGGIAALEPNGSESTGLRKLDARSPAAAAYLEHLARQQDLTLQNIEAMLERPVEILYHYVAANNGLALAVSHEEAARIATLPDLLYVQEDREMQPLTDAGPEWIGAGAFWDGMGGFVGLKGEGVVVGVIDTGINPLNPSFADVGGDGYDHANPLGRRFGVCDPANTGPPPGVSPYDPAFPCNDKLIGVWGYASVNGGSPLDFLGHGSHTASTVAGNVVLSATVEAPTTSLERTISGVAPHANIIAYAACCSLSALAAAIDQTILDGVDVVSFSIGSPTPSAVWDDFATVGFLNARAAGIFVAAAAGNDGPAADTVGSPADAPWLTSVGASTHHREMANSLVGMTRGLVPRRFGL